MEADRRTPPGDHDRGPSDELPHVLPSHLLRAEQLCPRRLSLERTARRNRNRGGDARFEVARRLDGDVRTAHATMRAPTVADFPPPSDLWPEQRLLYTAAAAGYLTLFGEEPARTAGDDAPDPYGTDLLDAGVRVTGGIGVALERPDGTAELRILHVGSRGFGRALLDDVDLHLLALRCDAWHPPGPLRVVAADVLELRVDTVDLDLAVARPAARAFLAERLARIDDRCRPPRPRPGADCAGCGYVAGCEAHA